jgi:flagellar biosynthetic protein FliP
VPPPAAGRRPPLGALLLLGLPACAPAHAVDLLANVVPGAKTELTVKMQILIIMTLLGLLPGDGHDDDQLHPFRDRAVAAAPGAGPAAGLAQPGHHRRRADPDPAGDEAGRRPDLARSLRALRPGQDRPGNEALQIAEKPISRFMLAQTSKAALQQIAHLAGEDKITTPAEHGFAVKLAAFVLSELKTAFQIGCMLFIPSSSSTWWCPRC